ncbi:MAG: DUF3857 domain-containing transglutaminase family protein [Sphingobacteriia bacterium]|nr:DUF3857 domain-containing transglutaminase family protein [Sphingobacteriia bacterium]
MKKFLVSFICFPFVSVAQNYAVSLIPDSLKENANAVKRFEETYITIKSIGKAIVKHTVAYTVLNESGDNVVRYENYYDKFHTITDISGKLFDANGKLLKSIKKKEVSDLAMKDDESLISDARLKRFSFFNRSYPYTVEFEEEELLDGLAFLPRWAPVDDENISVQQSRLVVETPLEYKFRYKQFNYDKEPKINSNKTIVYTWEISNKKAFAFEPFQPPLHEITPFVYLAPNEFEFGGYKGSMETWLDLGKYMNQLKANRDELPINVKQDIHKLVDHVPAIEDKVTLLYQYLQKNSRYISIQLGIGGWQPFEAKYVAEKKYGDCKALSNYMVSLLKEINIPAYYVLIMSGAGYKGLEEDFPSNYFNHVIACVPNNKDTIWLECTSQTASPGYLGSFTSNRKALLIAEDGGHVVTTPNYKVNDNLLIRHIDAQINTEGDIDMEVKTLFTGEQQELQHGLMHGATKEEKEKYLNTKLSLPTYKVSAIEYRETKGRIPAIDEYLKINASNYASVTGKRFFVAPNIFEIAGKKANDKPRKFGFRIRYAYRDIDSISIKIPGGYIVEAMPKDVEAATKFGKYQINFSVKDDVIKVYRMHEAYQGEFPSSEYESFARFYDTMHKADKSKIVFVKQE